MDGHPRNLRQKACRGCSAAKTRCDLRRPTCSRCTLRKTFCQYPAAVISTSKSTSSEISVEDHELPQKDSQKDTRTPQSDAPLEHERLCGDFNPGFELSTPESESLYLHSLLPSHLGVLENELAPTFEDLTNLDNLNYDYGLIRNIPDLSSNKSTQLAPSDVRSDSALKLSQHSMEVILRVTRTWPRMMAKGNQLPPIIHPYQLSDGNIPTPLANCFALVKMWDGQRCGGTSIVQQTVKKEAQAIISLFETFDERDLTAALQALMIYTLILLFPSNDQLSVSLLDDKLVKHLRTIMQYVVSTGVVLEEESRSARPLWECWVYATCKRRALLSLYIIHWAYSVYHCIPTFDCNELNNIPAPAAKNLWQSTSSEQWEPRYNRWLAQWDGPYYRQGELLRISPGVRIDPRAELWLEEADEFGMIFIAIGKPPEGILHGNS
ncbi:hypothetical protein EMCG_03952 [[Emmonsia] crescens]|uniref:Zn(2)-C6 fungal-type domain-containing protein n=1 Tax=[Emmonsia] crescens TaxID=73230 RepID=A0A0G2IZG7_9EURO|nr:hypothetical protein EMCG_03952 [Emmonsia crescens UAMH 3008]